MTNRTAETSPLVYARIAGFLYLIIFCLGIFAQLFVRQRLIVPRDAVTTVNNIMASESLFRLALVGDLIRSTCFILSPLVLYKLLKPVNKNIALLMVIFALVQAAIATLNMLNHLAALLLLSGADYLTVFTADQLYAQVMLSLNLYDIGYLIAQIFFGLYFLPLGYLVYKSGYFPRVLGVLLMIGCFGFLIDFVVFFLLPSYEGIMRVFSFSEQDFTIDIKTV